MIFVSFVPTAVHPIYVKYELETSIAIYLDEKNDSQFNQDTMAILKLNGSIKDEDGNYHVSMNPEQYQMLLSVLIQAYYNDGAIERIWLFDVDKKELIPQTNGLVGFGPLFGCVIDSKNFVIDLIRFSQEEIEKLGISIRRF